MKADAITETNDASLIAMSLVLEHGKGLSGAQQVHLSHAIMMAILEDRERNTLANAECDLLVWLGNEEFSQYGECHGKALDRLVALGFAQVHGPDEHTSGFIAQGSGDMYRAVSLTTKGRAARAAMKESK